MFNAVLQVKRVHGWFTAEETLEARFCMERNDLSEVEFYGDF
jgi:hypothetical protein